MDANVKNGKGRRTHRRAIKEMCVGTINRVFSICTVSYAKSNHILRDIKKPIIKSQLEAMLNIIPQADLRNDWTGCNNFNYRIILFYFVDNNNNVTS